ncbi:sigma 54-interacting transcriptional regulator [Haliangium ochraceum]|uniref:Sigma54 specific transcriptional regulator, Fis family n=1 Tax=Haliangium ochraceum (strain DSM 14365 / JCM 11303 / SMP-2) TaxID=502025 RepID=D0LUR0_HALO1|nr:sigma 54-interacting transcriptional regulator [Haliangium ochraceum]ACY13950.1 sigma54 specific transcriptional regulator, Fis family [Haliangium ochraceum DSM 14365]
MATDEHDATTPLTSSPPDSLTVRGFRLEIIEGPDSPTTWESAGTECTIGVHPSCSLVSRDGAISRFHCEIRVDDRGARVRDLGSMNGTFLDGVRVVDAFLKNDSLLRLGRSVLRFRYLSRDNPVRLSERSVFGQLVGESVAMRATFALLEPAAATDIAILLEGETGTGKSVAARSIHQESQRHDGPFVVFDCGSTPANLLESELFGHDKGAFTGANSERMGVFEEASGGTIFLDELGELPLALQPKLLGVLENRSLRRLGSSVTRSVDVRVVAATNRDLRAAVNDGRFREDLFYRVAVVTVKMPALRHRLDDLRSLVTHLLSRLAVAPERIESIMSPEFIATLRGAAWPGNIRELRNYLEHYLIFEGALPTRFDPAERPALPVDLRIPFSEAKQQMQQEFEYQYIRELLHAHGGKVAQAAEAAGLNRTSLYRLMQRHKLER